jgi:fluoride exporter
MPRVRATTKTTTTARVAPGSPFATIRSARSRPQWSVLAAISVGGAVGAVARFAISNAWPIVPNGFPWATFAINVTGCLLIGVLMVAIAEIWPRRRLLRPFLGTGVLGGYTSFSTYVVDAQHLLDQHAAPTALAYLLATLVCALVAVYIGTGLTRIAVAYTRRTREKSA